VRLKVREYLTPDGESLYRTWLLKLDAAVRVRVEARVLRFQMGNLGDHKAVGGGVWEARLPFGPGYRLYLGKARRELIILLLGGDKGSQSRDIRRARAHWADYLQGPRHGTS
jgi:putative addiction module killer protein